MELADKIRFALSTVSSIRDYTFPYLVSISGGIDARTGRHIGSGLRCEFQGRRYVLTALHVLKAADAYPACAISAGNDARVFQIHGETILSDQDANLALYELPADYFQGGAEHLPCWPLDKIEPARERRSTDYLVLHGFPGVDTYSSQHFQGVIAKSFAYGAMEKQEDVPSDLQPFQFALYFDSRDLRADPETRAELPDPHGLSGSPVWRTGAGGSGRPISEWRPDWCSLVGVATQWRPDAEVLVASEISRVIERLNLCEHLAKFG